LFVGLAGRSWFGKAGISLRVGAGFLVGLLGGSAVQRFSG
jgi:hypothetical protein